MQRERSFPPSLRRSNIGQKRALTLLLIMSLDHLLLNAKQPYLRKLCAPRKCLENRGAIQTPPVSLFSYMHIETEE